MDTIEFGLINVGSAEDDFAVKAERATQVINLINRTKYAVINNTDEGINCWIAKWSELAEFSDRHDLPTRPLETFQMLVGLKDLFQTVGDKYLDEDTVAEMDDQEFEDVGITKHIDVARTILAHSGFNFDTLAISHSTIKYGNFINYTTFLDIDTLLFTT